MTQWQMRVLTATIAFVAAYAMAYFAGLRINLTNSIATGIWLTQDRPVMVGEYVMVCPPDNDVVRLGHSRGYIPAGWCPGGYGPLMKRIAGDDGAHIAIRSDGMYVNGYRLPHSASLDQDGAGRPLVAWSPSSFQLASDEVLLYGDGTAASFDARYFGPVSRSLVLNVIVPILVQVPKEDSMEEPDDPVPTLPEPTHLQRIVLQKFADAEDLDLAIPFSPEEAAAAGAFEEPALPEAESEHESR